MIITIGVIFQQRLGGEVCFFYIRHPLAEYRNIIGSLLLLF